MTLASSGNVEIMRSINRSGPCCFSVQLLSAAISSGVRSMFMLLFPSFFRRNFEVTSVLLLLLFLGTPFPAIPGSAFYVRNASPTGTGSLRDVVDRANADNSATPQDPHHIYFDVEHLDDYATSGQKCLWVGESLEITRPMVIDGRYSRKDTLLPGASTSPYAKPRVLLRGSGTPEQHPNHIFHVLSDHVRISGLQLYGFAVSGIFVGISGGAGSPSYNVISYNRIGFLDLGPDEAGIWLNWELNPVPFEPEEFVRHVKANGIVIHGDHNLVGHNIVGGVHNGISLSHVPGRTAYMNDIVDNWVGVIRRSDGQMTTITRNLEFPPQEMSMQYEDAHGGTGTPAQWQGYSLNSDGIYVANAQGTLVESNFASGCFSAGIELWDPGAVWTTVRHNVAGMDDTLHNGLANGEYGLVLGNGASNNAVYYNDFSSNKFGGIGLFNWGGSAAHITNNWITDNYCGISSMGSTFYRTGTGSLIQDRGIYLHGSEVYGNVIKWNTVSAGNRYHSIEQRLPVGMNTVSQNY